MTGNRRKTKRFCIYLLLFSILVTSFGGISASAVGSYVNGDDSMYRTSLEDVENFLTATTYADYLEDHGKTALGKYGAIDLKNDIVGFMPENATEEEKEQVWTSGAIYWDETELGTKDAPVLITGDNSVVTFKINVDKAARYNIKVVYYTGDFDYSDAVEGDDASHLTSKSSAAERYVLVDGIVPYKEARSIEFEKVWTDVYTYLDENGAEQTYLASDPMFKEYVLNQANVQADSARLFLKDANGNELKPDKQLVATWIEDKYISDSTGYYSEPLSFYFSEGEHTVSLQAIREPLAIKAIYLETAPSAMTYQEYLTKHQNVPVFNGSESYKIQAEYPTITSDNTIYPLNDRSSAFSEPQDAALIRLNAIGGDKWQYVGQWIEWEINVPQDGMYSIVPRFQQSFFAGMYVSRRVYINGELPFAEANNLRFSYSSDWQTTGLNSGDANNPYMFYLKEGTNKIRFEVVLGDMSEILSTVEASLNSINEYYRKILMITGPDPDEHRDYGFDKLIPDVISGLRNEYLTLTEISERLTQLVGEKGDHATTLDRVALVCQRMSDMPGTIASQMGTLKDYSASLGTWLSDTQKQPLKIDYIVVQAPSAEVPEAEPGFFASLWYEIKKFIMSFFSDYNSLGSDGEAKLETNVDVEVWTMTSRDQAQIIRTMVDDNFTPNYEGINVDIKLVVGGALLPSTLAGTGPDVFIGAAQGDPVNYAIRSAVLSLNSTAGDSNIGYNFNDLENSVWNTDAKYEAFRKLIENGTVKSLDEVKTWFVDQAFVPLTLYGDTYALPLTMSFSMMFYRKDMFVELGIEVPNTWDDFYDIIYTLQSNSLDIGFPAGVGGSTILMYQQDETLYDEGDYDYYLELFQRANYDGDFEAIKNDANAIQSLNNELVGKGLVYIAEDGTYRPKTDGMTINLDSDISLAAFKDVCELFTMFDFPVTYDFANRFRSGEMPIAIADYTTYNTLIVFAPEINGLWEFTPLPGTPDPLRPEEINNVTIGAVSTIMMMRSAAEDEAVAFGSWAFMQWYVGAEIQSIYGNEMVALLGPSAKQPTANIQALENMAWSTEESNNLMSQFNAVTCTPEYPGSYIISRYTSFAFLDVVNSDAEPVEELQSQIVDINVELTRKREEFGLPTTDSVKEMLKEVEQKYPNWDEGR